VKYPGKIPVPENDAQLKWFDEAARDLPANPCVRVYGPGPDDKRCKDCRLFLRKGQYSNTYFKCLLRGNTNGPGTDHRANWDACKRFVQDT
jgi:hypothetical protein